MEKSPHTPEISILLPCLNEEKALRACLLEAIETIKEHSLDAEVLVIDNGSTDRSAEVVKEISDHFPKVRLLTENRRGYGSAYLKGLMEARGEYIFMADCDGTYDFKDIPRFINELKKGSDLVVGNRFSGNMHKDSMPWLHQYIGNPFLSFIVKKFFGVKINDIHCGARAISKKALEKITIYTIGMEFASEMIIKAAKRKLKITEVSISYKQRTGESKLRSFSDGWRHLRFILLYSPNVLFFIPGFLMFVIGFFSFASFYFTDPTIFGITLYVHPLFLSSLLLISGYQLIFFAGFARTYAITHLGDHDEKLESLYKHITIEKAGVAGILLALLGSSLFAYIFVKWLQSGFGSMNEVRNSLLALTLLTLGIQTFFNAFMLSILGIKEK